MYKLTVKDARTGEEQVKEFETAELAILYRDYHLAFGQWNGIARWVEERHITQEQQKFIVDEKTELINGEILRFYKLSEGLEIKLEEASGKSINGCWNIFREKRNKMLQLTDWTQLSDCELTIEDRKEFRGYRNYLRTLPVLYNDSTIIHAKVYSFEEWKKGKR
jgi:hypothetical protein